MSDRKRTELLRDLGVGNWGGCGPAKPPYQSAGARKEKLTRRTFARSESLSALPYAELRCASAFSFLDGSSLPEDLVARAAELALPAVALVDRNSVAGAPRFYKAAKAAGLRALVGAEVTIAEPSSEKGRSPKREKPGPPPPETRLTLLVESRAGYRNLCKLITAAARGKPKGAACASWEEIEAHAAGLHV